MSVFSSLSNKLTVGYQKQQRKLWHSANRSSKALLLAAVFCLFASIGLLGDITGLGHASLLQLALWTIFGAAMAACYLVVIMTRIVWLPLLILLQVGGSLLIDRLPAAKPILAPGPATEALRKRLTINAMGAVACISVSYTLFLVFITRSGKEFVELDTELHLARDIHRALVPRIETRIGAFDFLGVSSPSGEVGGDLVDVVEHDGEPEWTAYLVDVSGHGVPSGVLMGMVKSAVRMALTTPTPLEPMLSGLNDVLYEISQPQMFATFAALRPAGPGRIAYTLAGHLPILCWRAATDVVEELAVSQVPLGMLPGRDYIAAETSCASGDVFLVLTDGLTEVFDRFDREFGMEGVRATFAANAQSPLPQLEEALLTASRSHGTQLDDQSLILIRVL
jgi:phosphoserine phosphatase RsbU/P